MRNGAAIQSRGLHIRSSEMEHVSSADKSNSAAALPLPFRTTDDHPTFFNLPDEHGCTCPAPHGRTFPTALDPLYCNRYEIREFGKEAAALGINYLGVCCGATPMHIREVAEAAGLTVPASKYREKMENHFMYGTNERIAKYMQDYGDTA